MAEEISAAAVKALRERTGLPLMDCKKALAACGGNGDAALEWLRKNGIAVQGKRGDRETAFGRFGMFIGPKASAMVEVKCESAPVTKSEEFLQLCKDLARQLATGPGAATPDDLLAQPSPSKAGMTLKDQKDDMFNRIREVFNVGRMIRLEGSCGGYEHVGSVVHGVLVQGTGPADVLKDICMHVAASSPAALRRDEVNAADVDKERAILREAALKEGKPESIVDKMVEGRLKQFFAERVLLEQPFVKDPKTTVGQHAEQNKASVIKFVHWSLAQG